MIAARGEHPAAIQSVPCDAFVAEWRLLQEEGCVERCAGRFRLTPRGVKHADIVGQLFFSERVRRLMDEFEYDR